MMPRSILPLRVSRLACLATVVLVLTACGGGDGGSEGEMDARLVVGGEGAMVFMAVPLAEGLGYLEDEGVNLEVIDAGEAGRAISTLLARRAEFASGAFEHVIKAKAEGRDLRMTALYVRYPAMSLLVGADSAGEIQTVEDLRGSKVGTSSPGSAAHYNLLALLKQHGMAESDVELVFAGLSEMPAAIQNNQVEAAMVVDPFTTQALQDGTGEMLFDLGTDEGSTELYGSEYAMSGLMTRQEVIDDNPELVERMNRAVSRALQYIQTHSPEEIAAAVPDRIAPDEEIYAAAIEHMKVAFTESGEMPPEAAQTTVDVLVENGIVPPEATADVDQLYDMQFIEKANRS